MIKPINISIVVTCILMLNCSNPEETSIMNEEGYQEFSEEQENEALIKKEYYANGELKKIEYYRTGRDVPNSSIQYDSLGVIDLAGKGTQYLRFETYKDSLYIIPVHDSTVEFYDVSYFILNKFQQPNKKINYKCRVDKRNRDIGLKRIGIRLLDLNKYGPCVKGFIIYCISTDENLKIFECHSQEFYFESINDIPNDNLSPIRVP